MRAPRLAVLVSLLFPALPASAQTATPPPMRTEEVAPGVYAVLRVDPPGLMFEANGGFIVADADVVVVDGGSNPASAAEMLAAVRRVTPKPVRYVVHTHWHDDHVAGAQVWDEAFPGVEHVAHAGTARAMAGEGLEARRKFREGAPGAAASIRALVASGRGMAGGPLTDEERASHLSTLALAERAIRELPNVRAVAPSVVFDDRLTLVRGGRTIEVRWLGRAHTAGDAVVHLPAEGVVFAGDLVSWPVPLVGTTSFPLEFGPAVQRLVDLRPKTIVPGHGPVLRGDAYARLVVRLLTAIRERTQAAVARGETLEQARRSVDLSDLRRELAGDSPVRGLLFDQYVAAPAVARAYEAASAARRGTG